MNHTCKFEDDNGTICNAEVSSKQWKQDGICNRCADLLWNNYVLPISNDKEPIPIQLGPPNIKE